MSILNSKGERVEADGLTIEELKTYLTEDMMIGWGSGYPTAFQQTHINMIEALYKKALRKD